MAMKKKEQAAAMQAANDQAEMLGALTPLWVASYGCCGSKLMAVHAGGELETAEDE